SAQSSTVITLHRARQGVRFHPSIRGQHPPVADTPLATGLDSPFGPVPTRMKAETDDRPDVPRYSYSTGERSWAGARLASFCEGGLVPSSVGECAGVHLRRPAEYRRPRDMPGTRRTRAP